MNCINSIVIEGWVEFIFNSSDGRKSIYLLVEKKVGDGAYVSYRFICWLDKLKDTFTKRLKVGKQIRVVGYLEQNKNNHGISETGICVEHLEYSTAPLRKDLLPSRYTAVLGFNTKQWWAYDEKKDVYIDPPKEVLDSLPDWRDDTQASEEAFQKILDTNPSWLKDKAYTFKDIEI